MKAVIVDPFNRTVTERDIPLDANFFATVRDIIGCEGVNLFARPGGPALFVDAIGVFNASLRIAHAFWRAAADPGPEHNVVGIGVFFGAGDDGKLVDMPGTAKDVAQSIVWADDEMTGFNERMMLLDVATGGPAQPGKTAVAVVNRTVAWKPGAVTPAYEPPKEKPKRGRKRSEAAAAPDAGLYETAPAPQSAPPAAAEPPAATSPPAESAKPLAPAAGARVYALRETEDNRVRMIEYLVGPGGSMAEESMHTFANVDDARRALPAAVKSVVHADDETQDEFLIETWY